MDSSVALPRRVSGSSNETWVPLAGLQHACAKYEGYCRQEQDRNGLQRFVTGRNAAILRQKSHFLPKINQNPRQARPASEHDPEKWNRFSEKICFKKEMERDADSTGSLQSNSRKSA